VPSIGYSSPVEHHYLNPHSDRIRCVSTFSVELKCCKAQHQKKIELRRLFEVAEIISITGMRRKLLCLVAMVIGISDVITRV